MCQRIVQGIATSPANVSAQKGQRWFKLTISVHALSKAFHISTVLASISLSFIYDARLLISACISQVFTYRSFEESFTTFAAAKEKKGDLEHNPNQPLVYNKTPAQLRETRHNQMRQRLAHDTVFKSFAATKAAILINKSADSRRLQNPISLVETIHGHL